MESTASILLRWGPLSISFICILIMTTFCYRYNRKHSKLIKIIGYPIIGNLFQILPNIILKNLQIFKQIYGNLYELKIFNKRIIVISDKSILQEILMKRPKIFRRLITFDHPAKKLDVENGLFHANGSLLCMPVCLYICMYLCMYLCMYHHHHHYHLHRNVTIIIRISMESYTKTNSSSFLIS